MDEAASGRARRPGAQEHAPYYGRYISKAPNGDVTETLERRGEDLVELLRSVPPDRETFSYAAGKWSVREVVGHIIDCERIFGYRALHIARRDPAPLPDMDEKLWAAGSNAAGRDLSDLTHELASVRRATVSLFRGFGPEAWERHGVASGREISVRALAWIAAGHAEHHHAILLDRYGL